MAQRPALAKIAIAQVQAARRRQLGRRSGRAVLRQVARRGHQPVAHFAQRPRRQAGGQIARDAHRHVEAFLDQVDHAVGQGQLQVEPRVLLQQRRQARRQPGLSERDRRADAQHAMGRAAVLAGQRGDLARGGGHARAGGVDRLAQLGQREGARGPLQQAGAERRFQP
ncbi:hypothetical protein D3C72_1248730 [compost metagenome]